MRSVRIKPIGSDMVAIDITCDCGSNVMRNEITGERGFSHSVLLNGRHPSMSPTLVCDCGKRYKVVSQTDHIHINAL